MNYEKALKTIERILKDEAEEKICLFIDGQWGIGKTYTINKFIESNNDISLKYVSVFGKENLKEIEKDIVMQMLPVQKIKDKLDSKNSLRIFGSIVGDVLKQSSGIDIDFIRNISIENIKSDNNVIICIDDLERKSENIRLKDILGLVERAASNFNIILIGSLINLQEEEKKEFNSFKEKIIDYELVVDELSDSTLKEITNNRLKNINNQILDKIIATFKNNKLEGKYLLNNLRIYKKYISLLYKVNCEITRILDLNDNKLDDKIIELCNMVIYESYIEIDNTKKIRHLDYMTEQLRIAIEKIFKYEDYDEVVLKEYLEVHSQIQKDIKSLYQLYKLSKEEALEIVKRIEENIKLENKDYFIKQKYIIGLFDALHECGIIDSFKSGLIKVAEILYEPNLGEQPMHFNIDDYNVYDPMDGEQTNYNVYFIINHINKYNKKCYNKLIGDMLNNSIKEKDIKSIYDILQYHDVIDFKVFKEIYEFTFDMLNKEYSEITWNLLCRIISKTDSNLVELFLKREIENRRKCNNIWILTKTRLKRLLDIVKENKYFEWQEQQYIELQE